MNNNIQKYRIKQIGENKFIPQTSTNNIFALLFGDWDGIEYINETTTDVWYTELSQHRFCTVSTMEEAKHIIEIHKSQQVYPKYHPYK
jgi:hypothetical protein